MDGDDDDDDDDDDDCNIRRHANSVIITKQMHTNGTITIELNGTMIISHHETEGQTN
jgi:hypothetical protein